MSQTVVNVAGYGWSGSSAVVDLLRGTPGFKPFGTEFRVIKDPDGIVDLENALVNDWTHIKCDVAVRRFLTLARRLGRRWILGGENYDKLCNNSFYTHTREYITNLVDFQYQSTNYRRRMEKPLWKRYLEYGYKLLGGDQPTENIYYSAPEDEFRRVTREYLDNLVSSVVTDNAVDHVVLDQSIHPRQAVRSLQYFDDAKLILVDRDPRDVYMESREPGFVPAESIDQFVKHYRMMRNNADENEAYPNILKIQFEELVTNFESTRAEIFEFLNIDLDTYSTGAEQFDPSESIANVGLYDTDAAPTAEIEDIHNRLEQFCYERLS